MCTYCTAYTGARKQIFQFKSKTIYLEKHSFALELDRFEMPWWCRIFSTVKTGSPLGNFNQLDDVGNILWRTAFTISLRRVAHRRQPAEASLWINTSSDLRVAASMQLRIDRSAGRMQFGNRQKCSRNAAGTGRSAAGNRQKCSQRRHTWK
jgi:hypothetical protein